MPALENSHCTPVRPSTEIIESLRRIEKNNKLDCPECPPAVLPQPVMDLINGYNLIKRTILDIKGSLSTVTTNQLVIKLGSIGYSIRQDLEVIQTKFDEFETDFDQTIKFFSILNTNQRYPICTTNTTYIM